MLLPACIAENAPESITQSRKTKRLRLRWKDFRYQKETSSDGPSTSSTQPVSTKQFQATPVRGWRTIQFFADHVHSPLDRHPLLGSDMNAMHTTREILILHFRGVPFRSKDRC